MRANANANVDVNANVNVNVDEDEDEDGVDGSWMTLDREIIASLFVI